MKTSIKERMSSEEWIITIMISVALIAIVIFSFTGCVTVTHHPVWSAWDISTWNSEMYTGPNGKTTVYTTSYSPVFVCIFTAVQLLLLWLVNKKFVCVLGVILNIFATVLPVLSFKYFNMMGVWMKDNIYDYTPAYNEYAFGIIVYLIIGIGLVVTAWYFVLLHYRRKRIPRKAPAAVIDPDDQLRPEQ